MGNIESLHGELFSDHQKEWDFVGRNKDITRILELINISNVVEIFGMMKIGKTRLMKELIRRILVGEVDGDWTSMTMLYFDFELYLGDAEEGLVDCLTESFGSLNYTLKEEITISHLPHPQRLVRMFTHAVKDNSEVIIFLDNVQVIVSNCLEYFKSFVKQVTEKSHVKFVLTTNDRLQLTSRGFAHYVLGVLEEEDILELLHVVTDGRYRSRDNTNVHNEVYMKAIATLCEGLPLAAMLAGCELRSMDGFLKPSDMVEILFENRLKALSPDIYPREEKLSIYRDPIMKVKDLAPYFEHFLNNICQATPYRSIKMEDAVDAIDKQNASVGATKPEVIKLFNKGVVSGLQDNEFELHGAIRDCCQSQELLEIIELLPEETNMYESIDVEEKDNTDGDIETIHVRSEISQEENDLDPSTGDLPLTPQLPMNIPVENDFDSWDNNEEDNNIDVLDDETFSQVAGPPALPYIGMLETAKFE